MRTTVIYDTGPKGHRVVSHGNGLAYEFVHMQGPVEETMHELSVFFQGGDADRFREEIEAWEAHQPHLETREMLRLLWAEYAELAEEC